MGVSVVFFSLFPRFLFILTLSLSFFIHFFSAGKRLKPNVSEEPHTNQTRILGVWDNFFTASYNKHFTGFPLIYGLFPCVQLRLFLNLTLLKDFSSSILIKDVRLMASISLRNAFFQIFFFLIVVKRSLRTFKFFFFRSLWLISHIFI